jgi:S-formylglutathione hydrolase FrmB
VRRALRPAASLARVPRRALLLARAGHALERTARSALHQPSAGLHLASLRSVALRGRLRYAIWLPRGYATSTRRYPVVYLLHGLPDRGGAYRSSRAAELGEIAQRHGRRVIVVAPQGARPGDTDPEWHDWGPGRNWETATSTELVAAVDGRFRTIADRRARALIGISAGGYGATLIALHHPETYAVVESWSGYFHPTNPRGDGPLDVGTDRDNLLASAHTYVPCLARVDPVDRPRLLGFYVGDRDRHFLAENRMLHAELTAAGVPHLFRVYPGTHEDAFWDRHEDAWLMAGVRLLADTPPPDPAGPGGALRERARGAGCPLP